MAALNTDEIIAVVYPMRYARPTIHDVSICPVRVFLISAAAEIRNTAYALYAAEFRSGARKQFRDIAFDVCIRSIVSGTHRIKHER